MVRVRHSDAERCFLGRGRVTEGWGEEARSGRDTGKEGQRERERYLVGERQKGKEGTERWSVLCGHLPFAAAIRAWSCSASVGGLGHGPVAVPDMGTADSSGLGPALGGDWPLIYHFHTQAHTHAHTHKSARKHTRTMHSWFCS